MGWGGRLDGFPTLTLSGEEKGGERARVPMRAAIRGGGSGLRLAEGGQVARAAGLMRTPSRVMMIRRPRIWSSVNDWKWRRNSAVAWVTVIR